MAETIDTIEISKVIRAALVAVVPATDQKGTSTPTPVYARGVKTDIDGNLDAQAVVAKRRTPCVDVLPSERIPHFYESSIRAYPVRLRVVTYFNDDPFQVDLYTIANAVAAYLASAPTLALTLRKFDALVMDNAPETNYEESLQVMEWQITVNTGNAP